VHYGANGEVQPLCPTPATEFEAPWLADGFIAGFGPAAGTGQTDNEIFVFAGDSPNDSEAPFPPFVVQQTPLSHSVLLVWDTIIGATSYTIYTAREPGITKANFDTLISGRKISQLRRNYMRICGLEDGVPHYFVVTTTDPTGEGGVSAEVVSTPSSGIPTDLAQLTQLIACFTGPDGLTVPANCEPQGTFDPDVNCTSGFVDLKDFAELVNFVTE
jgi:hypothetical protein